MEPLVRYGSNCFSDKTAPFYRLCIEKEEDLRALRKLGYPKFESSSLVTIG